MYNILNQSDNRLIFTPLTKWFASAICDTCNLIIFYYYYYYLYPFPVNISHSHSLSLFHIFCILLWLMITMFHENAYDHEIFTFNSRLIIEPNNKPMTHVKINKYIKKNSNNLNDVFCGHKSNKLEKLSMFTF